MKKLDKKAFTLIELLVVVAILGVLVLLATPKFIGHTQDAERKRIQHDVKVMEQEIATVLISEGDDFKDWEGDSKNFNQLIEDDELFEKEGVAEKVESTGGPYKAIPEKYKDKINTKLKGTFYVNSGGKVYYEPKKEPWYSDEEIDDLIKEGFIPVATAEELNSIRNNEERTYGEGTEWEGEHVGKLDSKFIQVKDIDLSPIASFDPIGTDTSPFTGTYDGGGYVIRNLEVRGEGKDHQGLFGYTEGAAIRNVGLIDNTITGNRNVGSLVGGAIESTIENSYATGSVTGTGNNVGGLVGFAMYSTTIDNSYSTGPVSSSGSDVGGLMGFAMYSIEISNSYTTGSVTGTGSSVGGLVGWTEDSIEISNSYTTGSVTGNRNVGSLVGGAGNNTNIRNSYATGSVTGYLHVGGLVGYTSKSMISNSYATGSVEGNEYVGGLVGSVNNSTEISNSYATGSVEGSGLVGGFVGRASDIDTGVEFSGTIENSYWDTDATGQPSSPGGAEGKTTDDMMKKATYEDWDFTNIWEITPGSYPTLR